MNDLYDPSSSLEADSVDQPNIDACDLTSENFTDLNLPETEANWQETQTQWDSDWQNETSGPAFEYQPDESWHSFSSPEQGFNNEMPEGLIDPIPHRELGFGGLRNVHWLADLQVGPTCGYETIENIVQCFHPYISNGLSDQLQMDYPGRGGALNPEDYRAILDSYDIPSHWASLDRQELVNALDENRPVVFVGDAHDLDSFSYPEPQSWHAITLTDVSRDIDGNVTGYWGIDSNFPGEEKMWSCSQIEQASEHFIGEILVTDKPASAWPFQTT